MSTSHAHLYACRLCLLIHGSLLGEDARGWLRSRSEILRHLEDTHRISGDEHQERLLVRQDNLRASSTRPVLLKADGTEAPCPARVRGARLRREELTHAIGSEQIDFVLLPGELLCLVVNDGASRDGLKGNALATAFCDGRRTINGDALLIRYGEDYV